MSDTETQLKYMWKSQYYEFGNYMKELHDTFMEMNLPYEQKKKHLNTIRCLYNDCLNETLKWENIQSKLFLDSDLLDTLIEYSYMYGTAIKERLAFQYVCIQLAQWEEEERSNR